MGYQRGIQQHREIEFLCQGKFGSIFWIFVDADGRTYLLYSTAGESALAVAELQTGQ